MSIIDNTVAGLKVTNVSNVESSDNNNESDSSLTNNQQQIIESDTNNNNDNDDNENDDEPPQEVDYETQRERNILENQKLMLELGLSRISFSRSLSSSSSTTTEQGLLLLQPHSKNNSNNLKVHHSKPRPVRFNHKKRFVPDAPQSLVPSRSSKRIRGEEPKPYFKTSNSDDDDDDDDGLEKEDSEYSGDDDDDDDDDDDGDDDNDDDDDDANQEDDYGRRGGGGQEGGLDRRREIVDEPVIPDAACPLTLGSISTTIWDLGTIYTGTENRLKYWSSKGSKYRHPYPIGFRAEKIYFREKYMMHIKEGPEGPIFSIESEKGKVFEGTSPTQPWTKACLASYSRGTRISGPLFFGFSDVVTMKMIQRLDGYQNYEDVLAQVRLEESVIALAEAAAAEAAEAKEEQEEVGGRKEE
ncbi:hypothetical protein BG004_007933 [Podila humilis]|nr:hypothetical protein BG004_007933 [Podila humilis]